MTLFDDIQTVAQTNLADLAADQQMRRTFHSFENLGTVYQEGMEIHVSVSCVGFWCQELNIGYIGNLTRLDYIATGDSPEEQRSNAERFYTSAVHKLIPQEFGVEKHIVVCNHSGDFAKLCLDRSGNWFAKLRGFVERYNTPVAHLLPGEADNRIIDPTTGKPF